MNITISQPTSEQFSHLSRSEKVAYHIADWCNRTLKRPFMLWNACFMYAIIWIGLSRRLTVKGLEHISDLNENSAVLIASNHRTFFDFFVITWINFDRTSLPRNIYFPVRSNFFYDNIFGVLLNIIMGGCAMFPPIFRNEPQKEFNRYSLQRIMNELHRGATTIGFHPEGTRNKNTDPYSLLPAKPGIGYVIQNSPQASIVPIFIKGITNNYIKEAYRNWVCPKQHPITVYYGEQISFVDSDKSAQLIAEDVLEQIAFLAEVDKKQTKD